MPAGADFVEYQRARDRRRRDQLVEGHLDLAYSIARRFIGRGEELDDLKQVALLALVQAAERFDPSRGLAFSTFATPTISGSLKRHFRDRTWAIRPPRPVQERYLEVNAAVETLTGTLRRVPTITEIAAYLKWPEERARDALAARVHRHLEHWGGGADDGQPEPGTVDDQLAEVEDRSLVDDLLGELGARERAIVKMRFFDELGQRAIGRRVGVSQMQVSRLIAASLHNLRDAAAANPLSPDGRLTRGSRESHAPNAPRSTLRRRPRQPA